MIETELGELQHAIAVEGHAGRNEVRVKAGFGRDLKDFLQILAGRGLAARQVHLQDAEFGGLTHDVLPFGSGELGVDALQLRRVGAVGTLERAAMRQLAQHAHRCAGAGRVDRFTGVCLDGGYLVHGLALR